MVALSSDMEKEAKWIIFNFIGDLELFIVVGWQVRRLCWTTIFEFIVNFSVASPRTGQIVWVLKSLPKDKSLPRARDRARR